MDTSAFTGLNMSKKGKVYIIGQRKYAYKLNDLLLDCSFVEFRSSPY